MARCIRWAAAVCVACLLHGGRAVAEGVDEGAYGTASAGGGPNGVSMGSGTTGGMSAPQSSQSLESLLQADAGVRSSAGNAPGASAGGSPADPGTSAPGAGVAAAAGSGTGGEPGVGGGTSAGAR
jgi:hypothetical protein